MDSSILAFVLAAATGWGIGGIFDRDPMEYPPRPCTKCPYPAGAVVSVILWALLGVTGRPDEIAVPAVAVGIAGGLFGGSLSGFLGGWGARRPQ